MKHTSSAHLKKPQPPESLGFIQAKKSLPLFAPSLETVLLTAGWLHPHLGPVLFCLLLLMVMSRGRALVLSSPSGAHKKNLQASEAHL